MTGKVVLVRFPFSDLESSKKRPALILNQIKIRSKVNLCQIAMITSRIDGIKFPRDTSLKHWKSTGLLYPSLVRLDKLATIDTDLIDKVLGTLDSPDMVAVRKVLESYFSHF